MADSEKFESIAVDIKKKIESQPGKIDNLPSVINILSMKINNEYVNTNDLIKILSMIITDLGKIDNSETPSDILLNVAIKDSDNSATED